MRPNSRPDCRSPGAFTLVEVVLAVGIFAMSIVALLGLMGPGSRQVASIAGYDKAAALGDAIQCELVRLRDAAGGGSRGLEHIAELISDENPLRLAASPDGLRAVHESEASATLANRGEPGLAPRERYFLVEVRRQPDASSAPGDAGFIAVTATIKWPYQIATGPGADDAMAADLAQSSSLQLNFAVSP